MRDVEGGRLTKDEELAPILLVSVDGWWEGSVSWWPEAAGQGQLSPQLDAEWSPSGVACEVVVPGAAHQPRTHEHPSHSVFESWGRLPLSRGRSPQLFVLLLIFARSSATPEA